MLFGLPEIWRILLVLHNCVKEVRCDNVPFFCLTTNWLVGKLIS